MNVSSLLRQLPIFADLDEAALQSLAARAVTRTFAGGNVLFSAGDPCRGLYIIESGRVRIYRSNDDGKEQVLHVEGPGRPVAELALFDGGPYPASAITIEETRLVFLPRADFEQVYRAHPDIAHAIIRSLGRRLRHLVRVAETLAFRDVAARLALLLIGYAERAGQETADGIVIALDRTQEELAIEIGAARESVSRAMKQLRRRGLIQSAGRGRLLIPDLAQLRAMLPGAEPQPSRPAY
jgi:CRP/FNR family transcriptional regulator